jgi:hypothetical protein
MKNLLIKTYFFLFLGIFCAYQAQACQLSIPESYMDTFLNPPVSGHYEKCEDKPEESCVCVDDIDPWTAVKIDEVDDIGVYTGKKLLRHSPVRKAAKEAKKEAEKLLDGDKKAKKKAAKDKVKGFKFKGSTIKELRDELNDFMNENKEAQE